MPRFALIGAAGFVAPRHMQAMAAIGGELVAAVDPNDSVGVIDSYFPNARFFTQIEQFEEYLHKLRADGRPVDYLTVVSPTFLHAAHIRIGLNAGMDVICEKPVVMEPSQLDDLAQVEAATGHSVHTILQLRLHPSFQALKKRLAERSDDARKDVELTYITARGDWFLRSWKCDERKSGGIVAEIGIHFIDLFHVLFGALRNIEVHHQSQTRSAGCFEFDGARVRWFLSVEMEDLPARRRAEGHRAFRCISLDGEELDLSGGFTDLHTRSYEEILAGRGFGLLDNRGALGTISTIRGAAPTAPTGEHHPMLTKIVG